MDEATIAKIAGELLRYLDANPRAKDTKEGIAKWWIARQRISESAEGVYAALLQLKARGEVTETALPDGTTVYEKTKLDESQG